jgi:hypothetical protein
MGGQYIHASFSYLIFLRLKKAKGGVGKGWASGNTQNSIIAI